MTEQPTALRLADALAVYLPKPQDMLDAATELRRLHAENQRCRSVCDATSEGWRADAEEWKAQRDALLEALKLARLMLVAHGETHAKIDAVIKAVEEGK